MRAQSWFSLNEARRLVREHAQWLLERLATVKARLAARPTLTDGTELPLLDESLRVDLRVDAQLCLPLGEAEMTANRRGGRVVRHRDRIRIEVSEAREETVRELLCGWYREMAGTLLGDRLAHLSLRVGRQPRKLRIGAQRSRWGSCSAGGTVSLNWRLLLLPSEVVDYVLVHELCHLVHLDHSRAFWALVEAHCPDYRSQRTRLREAQEHLAL